MDGEMLSDSATDVATAIEMFDVPMFIVDIDDEGCFVFCKVNQAHEERTGVQTRLIAGKKIGDVLPHRVAQTVTANYQNCVDRRARYSYEEMLLLPSGELWWETTLTPVFDSNGEVRRILGAAIDITERKQRSFRETKTITRLNKLNQDLKTFTTMAAHDLRGPLGNIKSLVAIVSDGFHELGDSKLELIKTIGTVAEKAMDQVEEILRYARALDVEESEMVEVDFAHLCADVCGVLDPEGLVEVTYPSILMETDAVMLQMIIRNLTHNAIKFGNGAIVIDAETDKEKPGNILFTVADNGPGFPREQQDVDTVFTSGISDATNGFGLAAIQHLVAMHDSELKLDAPLFKTGATLRFSLRGVVKRDRLETLVHHKVASS